MFSGKLLVKSYLLSFFVGQAIGKFSTGRVPRSVHCWQAIGRLHTTRKMVLTPWFIAVNTIAYWGLPCRRRPSSNDFYKPKKPFEKSLRAPMEDQGTKVGTVTGSKADQKKIQPRDLFWRPKFEAILASSNRPLSVARHTNFHPCEVPVPRAAVSSVDPGDRFLVWFWWFQPSGEVSAAASPH